VVFLLTERGAAALAIDIEQYYRDYGPMVLRRCRALLRNEELAVDAMQDTFVQLLRNRDALQDVSPQSLLYRVCTNVCLNKIREMSRRKDDSETELIEKIASYEEPEGHLFARSLLSRLFARERASTQQMAVLHLLDGMTIEEVAKRVEMSVSGVRKRLAPLRGALLRLEGVEK
jgi:RNA polymerase sigma-70 factor (ECF subfamily)